MKFLLMFLIVLGTLALFNPDERDFASYMGERAQTVVTDNARQTSGGGLLGGPPGRAQVLTASQFERNSYVVFSTFTTDLLGTSRGVDWRYMGIGGQFFTLKRPKAQG